MDFGDALVIGYCMARNKKGGSAPTTDDDWKPPSWWINIPEPEPYEIIMLVNITSDLVDKPMLPICQIDENGYCDADGTEYIDWGDGYIDNFVNGYRYCYAHKYSETGQYIVRVKYRQNASGIEFQSTIGSSDYYLINGEPNTGSSFSPANNALLAIKFGAGTGLSYGIYGNLYRALKYIKFKEQPLSTIRGGSLLRFNDLISLAKIEITGGFTDGSLNSNAFIGCYSLLNADFTKQLTKLPSGIFNQCYSLRSVDFSSLQTIPDGTYFNQCYSLSKVYAPELLTLGSGAFGNCTSLQIFEAPKLQSLQPNCFYNCFNLQEVIIPDDCNLNGYTPSIGCPVIKY